MASSLVNASSTFRCRDTAGIEMGRGALSSVTVASLRPVPSAEADLRRFAVDEKRCCQFWGFAVATTDHDLTLRWDGPPNTVEILDQP